MSVFPTITDHPQFAAKLEEVSGSKADSGIIISVQDSNWDMSIISSGLQRMVSIPITIVLLQ